ncbi:MAG TPA: mechanosensitive ion channel family protein, partial [Candidatus Methylomirabilis sp.]|nr:mechanosensitive ion channel family protein [Candidatus Methylomirabilis sp.]
ESQVIIKVRLKTQPMQQWAVGREYRRRIKQAFDAEGIEIPFPHRAITVGEASKPFPVLLTDRSARAGTTGSREGAGRLVGAGPRAGWSGPGRVL